MVVRNIVERITYFDRKALEYAAKRKREFDEYPSGIRCERLQRYRIRIEYLWNQERARQIRAELSDEKKLEV
ncbi:hypothetical protein R70331_25810 [Paenibacillus sp. FSL R7-0331]|nr:hypothetical protein R70331_25810 [Paenibacillus sp. FSL R7-0331]